jgi:hypothetical protein
VITIPVCSVCPPSFTGAGGGGSGAGGGGSSAGLSLPPALGPTVHTFVVRTPVTARCIGVVVAPVERVFSSGDAARQGELFVLHLDLIP